MEAQLSLNFSEYKKGPHYIGMLNHMFLWCKVCKLYVWAELLVKNTNDFKYSCENCGTECK